MALHSYDSFIVIQQFGRPFNPPIETSSFSSEDEYT